MNEDEKSSIKTWEAETDTNLWAFLQYLYCLFTPPPPQFFFPTQIDTMKIILQLQVCSEGEYKSRIVSAFSNKTKQA